jgi:catechol 2,3-dioxygenase-like lactoylglutathione lyase family enzyme
MFLVEVIMSSTLISKEQAAELPRMGTVETKLEVIMVPVSDVDRAKRFYEGLGWRVDADFSAGGGWRAVQVTPPGSPCSVIFGKGITTATAGSVQGLVLVVDDIEAARAQLVASGVDVSEVFHFDGVFYAAGAGTTGRVPGRGPRGQSYRTFLSFSDPDGNGWLIQEVKARLPGRGLSTLDVPTLTELLREAEERHGGYEATAPKHHWSTWYAAYIVARERGRTPDEAAKDAGLHTARSRQ